MNYPPSRLTKSLYSGGSVPLWELQIKVGWFWSIFISYNFRILKIFNSLSPFITSVAVTCKNFQTR